MEVAIFPGKMYSLFGRMASTEQSLNSFVLYGHAFRTLGSILIQLTIQPFQSNQHDDIVLIGQAVPGDPFGRNFEKLIKKFFEDYVQGFSLKPFKNFELS